MKLKNYDEKTLRKMYSEEENLKIELKRPKKELYSGEWITIEVAKEYSQKGKSLLAETSGQIIGEVRELALEAKEKYGLTELEAINIVRGYLLNDIVAKYDELRREIERGENS